MNQRHYLLKGTFILTATGLFTRAAGFLYKIFLSRTIGAAQIGLFQLTLPVAAFGMALSCGGIQTAVSRFTAEYYAEKDSRSALRILFGAILLSGGLSAACAAAMFFGAAWIARSFLLEPSCTALLQMVALSLPFSALHGCIGGFFIGRKNVSIPAAAQLIEQLLRIVSVLLIFLFLQKSGRAMDASAMALGQLAGELSAALFCAYQLFFGAGSPFSFAGRTAGKDPGTDNVGESGIPTRSPSGVSDGRRHSLRPGRADLRRTVSVSLPLGLNRMLICVLQGMEAALLPQMLQRFGCDGTQALAVYGTLTGMAMPLILFPTAITSSLGTLLLPAVSEARALRQDKKITGTVDASFRGSLLLGLFCLCAFLLFGDNVGALLFHSELAGIYTRKLALLCPFLYINTTLVSILHGLGATTLVTVWNTAAFGIRLAAIVCYVPQVGIDGYFAGTLLSQAFLTVCSLFLLRRDSDFSVGLSDALIKPGLVCIISGVGFFLLQRILPCLAGISWASLLLSLCAYTALFLLLAFFLLLKKPERLRLLQRPTAR